MGSRAVVPGRMPLVGHLEHRAGLVAVLVAHRDGDRSPWPSARVLGVLVKRAGGSPPRRRPSPRRVTPNRSASTPAGHPELRAERARQRTLRGTPGLNGPVPPARSLLPDIRRGSRSSHATGDPRSYAPPSRPGPRKCIACWDDEPHWRSTLHAAEARATATRRPPALRVARCEPCSPPAWLTRTRPTASSPDRAGDRRRGCARARAPSDVNRAGRSEVPQPASAPLRLPIGGTDVVDDDRFTRLRRLHAGESRQRSTAATVDRRRWGGAFHSRHRHATRSGRAEMADASRTRSHHRHRQRALTLEGSARAAGHGAIMPEVGARIWKCFTRARRRTSRFADVPAQGSQSTSWRDGVLLRARSTPTTCTSSSRSRSSVGEEGDRRPRTGTRFEATLRRDGRPRERAHEVYDKPYLSWKIPGEAPPDLDMTPGAAEAHRARELGVQWRARPASSSSTFERLMARSSWTTSAV